MTKSIYDQLNASGTIVKKRFVETFSGDALDTDRWNVGYYGGSGVGTAVMNDSVDGGLSISTSSGSSNETFINFGTPRNFAHNGSVMIAVAKQPTTASGLYVGFSNATTSVRGTNHSYSEVGISATVFSLHHMSASSAARTNTTINSDSNWHTHKLELTSSNNILSIDGVVGATANSNIPTNAQQPYCQVQDVVSNSNTVNIRYMECYNT